MTCRHKVPEGVTCLLCARDAAALSEMQRHLKALPDEAFRSSTPAVLPDHTPPGGCEIPVDEIPFMNQVTDLTCSECGYAYTGTLRDACPECGK